MGLISLTLPNDGETIDAADVNSPLNTIATAINGNLDNANIKTAAAIDGSKLADNSIPNTKMINAPLGWTAFANTPNTVTYNGNRNYDLVFNSVDLTDSLSPGMKLQLTRTVAAPDQCADLEASSSQYFSKASPNKLTFTDDFVVSAWVKLESYTNGTIISRYNGTSGFDFNIQTSGTVQLAAFNGGSGNYSYVLSYASLPLNKWVHIAALLDMSAFTAASGTAETAKSWIMIDGVEVAAQVARAGTNPTALVQAGNLEIGGRNGGLVPFDGKIAQAAIFNTRVLQATMRGYMSQGLSGSETSLASAYSFDGVITDLNTTTPNDLTANGGAVATNADSPFANAVAAGLLEYAEINAVTFSTNTTVNVRVPDTCMIPTSGGVSAVSYSTQSNPYGLPHFGNILSYNALLIDKSTSGTGDTEVEALATTVYVPTGRRIKVSVTPILQAGAGANLYCALWDGAVGGTGIAETITGTSGIGSNHFSIIINGASGTKTYRVSIRTSSGTAQMRGNATFTPGASLGPSFIQVELV